MTNKNIDIGLTKDSNSEGWNEVTTLQSDMHDWEAEKTLVGKLSEVREDVGPNNSTIYVLEKADGSFVSFWGNTVLDARFEKVVPGTECRIDYLGYQDSKNGRKYRNFKVYTK